jgi:hypothetical protein
MVGSEGFTVRSFRLIAIRARQPDFVLCRGVSQIGPMLLCPGKEVQTKVLDLRLYKSRMG